MKNNFKNILEKKATTMIPSAHLEFIKLEAEVQHGPACNNNKTKTIIIIFNQTLAVYFYRFFGYLISNTKFNHSTIVPLKY